MFRWDFQNVSEKYFGKFRVIGEWVDSVAVLLPAAWLLCYAVTHGGHYLQGVGT